MYRQKNMQNNLILWENSQKMDKKYSKKKTGQSDGFRAKNERAVREPPLVLPDNPPVYGDSDPANSDGFRHLHPNYPDPDGPLEPLSDTVIHSLTKRVVGHMKKLRPGLDLVYWKRVTRQIFPKTGKRSWLTLPEQGAESPPGSMPSC